jgi:vesicle coat complex subunit
MLLPNIKLLKFNPISMQVKLLCIDIFAKYLDDPEAEVRKAVCLNLDKIFENLGKEEQCEKILKNFKKIEKDTQPFVKSNYFN